MAEEVDGAGEEAREWWYLDATEQELGPFPGKTMREWFKQGSLRMGENLLVRFQGWKQYARLCDVYPDLNEAFVGPRVTLTAVRHSLGILKPEPLPQCLARVSVTSVNRISPLQLSHRDSFGGGMQSASYVSTLRRHHHPIQRVTLQQHLPQLRHWFKDFG